MKDGSPTRAGEFTAGCSLLADGDSNLSQKASTPLRSGAHSRPPLPACPGAGCAAAFHSAAPKRHLPSEPALELDRVHVARADLHRVENLRAVCR